VRRIRQFLFDNGEVDDLKFQEKFWKIINKIKAFISLKAWGTEIELSGEKATEGIRAGAVIENLDDYLKDALSLLRIAVSISSWTRWTRFGRTIAVPTK
jgi:hypothetical protein